MERRRERRRETEREGRVIGYRNIRSSNVLFCNGSTLSTHTHTHTHSHTLTHTHTHTHTHTPTHKCAFNDHTHSCIITLSTSSFTHIRFSTDSLHTPGSPSIVYTHQGGIRRSSLNGLAS